MPSRNTLKPDVAEAYYHIYARGASKQPIFLESADYQFFISLFGRYLSPTTALNKAGMPYPNYGGKIELLAYCALENHFHLLVYQIKKGAMTDLMRAVMTSYSRYFNYKYSRSGSLFESRYKASMIITPDYLEHISRYIHLNPRYWKRYPYSSLAFYKNEPKVKWLNTQRVLGMFDDIAGYISFLNDYEDHKNMLDEIKSELAQT